MENDMPSIVAAFLEGMYYAGKLPSRRESDEIAEYLMRHQLRGAVRLVVEQSVIEQINTLYARIESTGSY